jgi:hypothetical protein
MESSNVDEQETVIPINAEIQDLQIPVIPANAGIQFVASSPKVCKCKFKECGALRRNVRSGFPLARE